jgi:hypothetical protein
MELWNELGVGVGVEREREMEKEKALTKEGICWLFTFYPSFSSRTAAATSFIIIPYPLIWCSPFLPSSPAA